MADNQLAVFIEAGHQIFATKCWYIGASALVFFDHFILFGNEVKYIWGRKFTLVTFLYLFVRYYSWIAVILDAVLIFDPYIDLETYAPSCKRAAFIEPILATMPLLAAANTLLILRVRALYGQARVIPLLLFGLMLSQIAAGMWIYLQPGKTVLPPPPTSSSVYIECINLPNPALGSKSAIYLFLETAFDSAVFLLTSYKTYNEVLSGKSRIRAILARDGMFYYGVIFASCLTWALMVLFAPPALQYINAIPTNCLTAIMVCRITLNLREAGSTKQGWVNEPSFSLSTLRFSRFSGWPASEERSSEPLAHYPQQNSMSGSGSDLETRQSKWTTTASQFSRPTSAGGVTTTTAMTGKNGTGNEVIELEMLYPPPQKWQSTRISEKNRSPSRPPSRPSSQPQQKDQKKSRHPYANPHAARVESRVNPDNLRYELPRPPPIPKKDGSWTLSS